ncbi:WAS/WASL-interacting protein family member 1-like [Gopherus flavomarginatus]|uniref:WAS/WASL-interacting protein family member 1-like n=1 Tax=Gopherus flavomarginatus TaxID=286002 RepID=UPI0021CBD070|nr:WAS/WASL-interacting protein family member 1-like [Gopherus flavomarginatus]
MGGGVRGFCGGWIRGGKRVLWGVDGGVRGICGGWIRGFCGGLSGYRQLSGGSGCTGRCQVQGQWKSAGGEQVKVVGARVRGCRGGGGFTWVGSRCRSLELSGGVQGRWGSFGWGPGVGRWSSAGGCRGGGGRLGGVQVQVVGAQWGGCLRHSSGWYRCRGDEACQGEGLMGLLGPHIPPAPTSPSHAPSPPLHLLPTPPPSFLTASSSRPCFARPMPLPHCPISSPLPLPPSPLPLHPSLSHPMPHPSPLLHLSIPPLPSPLPLPPTLTSPSRPTSTFPSPSLLHPTPSPPRPTPARALTVAQNEGWPPGRGKSRTRTQRGCPAAKSRLLSSSFSFQPGCAALRSQKWGEEGGSGM